MKTILAIVACLALSACVASLPVETPSPTPLATQPATAQPPTASPSAQPFEPAATRRARLPFSALKGNFRAELLPDPPDPSRPTLRISGFLPNACYRLTPNIEPPDEQNRVRVTAAALPGPATGCGEEPLPVTLEVRLGPYAAGTYTLVFNEEEQGTFRVP